MDQQEAVKQNEFPEEVQATEPAPVEDYTNENEAAKEKIAKYGFTDFEQFMVKVTSDSIFARKVIRDLFGFDQDQPFFIGNIAGSRQENNITGVLVHSEFPPVLKNSTTTDDKPAGNPPETA